MRKPGFQEAWNLAKAGDPLLENYKAPPDNENVILGGAINKARAVGNSLDVLRWRLCLTEVPT